MSLFYQNLYLDRQIKDWPLATQISKKIDFVEQHLVDGEQHPGNGLLLTRNRGAFIKPCPGQKGSVCCGYWVVEWGMGCPFACEYCIIQNYTGAQDVTLYLNWEDCHREIIELRQKVKGPIRLGTGQYGDPLGLEAVFPLNAAIIDWTVGMADFNLEIKSKSDNVDAIMQAQDASHVTLAFSLNPQNYIDQLEPGTAPLKNRLQAAVKVAKTKGCALAFHFDPLLPLADWQQQYSEVFALMYQHLQGLKINWISLGTFRFPKGFAEQVEKYHPGSEILAEEFYPSTDGKIRYFRPFREQIYSFARAGLQQYFADVPIYLCMETPEVWERLNQQSFNSNQLKKMLDQSLLG